ncbi:hypothetical protein SFIMM107S_01724 [Streptomyces griseus]
MARTDPRGHPRRSERLGCQVTEGHRPPADIATRLGVNEGELCVCTTYEFLAEVSPAQLSTSWEPYDLTAGTLIVLPEGGPHAGAGVVNHMAEIGITVSHAVEQPEPQLATAEESLLLGIQKAAFVSHIKRTYYSDQGRRVETADIVLPAALCEIVYEVPIGRPVSGGRSWAVCGPSEVAQQHPMTTNGDRSP